MGSIAVHEFITLDCVIDAPTWTFDYPFDPKMGATIGGIMGSSKAILLGRRTYEEFAPAWSARTAEQGGPPGLSQRALKQTELHPRLGLDGVQDGLLVTRWRLVEFGQRLLALGQRTDRLRLLGRPEVEQSRDPVEV